MDKDTLKTLLKELLKESLEVHVDVWEVGDSESSHVSHRVHVTVELDGELVAEQDDSGW